jgi:hypothetical protein
MPVFGERVSRRPVARSAARDHRQRVGGRSQATITTRRQLRE